MNWCRWRTEQSGSIRLRPERGPSVIAPPPSALGHRFCSCWPLRCLERLVGSLPLTTSKCAPLSAPPVPSFLPFVSPAPISSTSSLVLRCSPRPFCVSAAPPTPPPFLCHPSPVLSTSPRPSPHSRRPLVSVSLFFSVAFDGRLLFRVSGKVSLFFSVCELPVTSLV